MEGAEELADRLLFDKPVEKRKSVNTSLLAKIKKMKMKSKDKMRKVHT